MNTPYHIRIVPGRLFVNGIPFAAFLDTDNGDYTVAGDVVDREPEHAVRLAFGDGYSAGRHAEQRDRPSRLPVLGDVD